MRPQAQQRRLDEQQQLQNTRSSPRLKAATRTGTRTALGQTFAKDFSVAVNQLTVEKDAIQNELRSAREELNEERKKVSESQQRLRQSKVGVYCARPPCCQTGRNPVLRD